MTGHRITLLGSHDRELRDWLYGDPNSHERGAIVLFRRLARKVDGQQPSDRYLVVEIIKMSGDWILESSSTHIKINLRKFPELYFRCETEGLELGFAHSHPHKHVDFSAQDTENEKNILHGLAGCNTDHSFLVTMLLADNKWHARIRQGIDPNKILKVRHICVVSDKMEIHGISIPHESVESLKRQETAFGKPFNAKLQSLRAVVVGVGGTGSPLATLLARAGVGELILIDGDFLEETNMNRVRGYCSKDINKNKAQSLANYISSIRPDISVSAFATFLNESDEAIDALSSADVIFGCTDDQAGRNIMNQAMYYHAQVFIDVGLTGKIDFDSDGDPYLRDHRGRISCILPEYGSCLRCQRVVTEQKLKYEQAIKDNPSLAKLDAVLVQRELEFSSV